MLVVLIHFQSLSLWNKKQSARINQILQCLGANPLLLALMATAPDSDSCWDQSYQVHKPVNKRNQKVSKRVGGCSALFMLSNLGPFSPWPPPWNMCCTILGAEATIFPGHNRCLILLWAVLFPLLCCCCFLLKGHSRPSQLC